MLFLRINLIQPQVGKIFEEQHCYKEKIKYLNNESLDNKKMMLFLLKNKKYFYFSN
jgi:hypothetical protein